MERTLCVVTATLFLLTLVIPVQRDATGKSLRHPGCEKTRPSLLHVGGDTGDLSQRHGKGMRLEPSPSRSPSLLPLR